MTRFAWLLLVCPIATIAAPVPKASEKEQIEKLYGTIEDPEKDCKFSLDGEHLKITMKGGKQYEWDMDGKVTNCPRLVREVKGDFVATVKAYAELPEKAEKAGGKWAEAGAGLILIGEKDRAIRTGMHDFQGSKRNRMLIVPNSYGPAGFEVKGVGGGAYVRLTRKGDTLTMGMSTDGKKWTEPISMGSKMPDSFRVGVYAFGNNKEDVTVTLAEFSVEPLKAEKKEDKK